MALTKWNSWLTAVLTVFALASSATAQQWQPFIEPNQFNPDLQFFAPAEVSDFGGGEPPNVGFYFDYDRLYINVSRPDGVSTMGEAADPKVPTNLPPDPVLPGEISSLGSLYSPWEGDFTWGNRFDFGYMTEDKVGWNMVAWHIDGPNEFLETRQERINRINLEDAPFEDPAFPIQDRNPRDYYLKNSINAATMSSFELNRVWRRKEFHNGGVFEPMIGVRFMKFDDYVRRDRYARYIADPLLTLNFPETPQTATGPGEVLTIDKTHWENNMLGPQLGFRLSKTVGHWNLSTELRGFAMQNWQFFSAQQTRRYTLYDAPAGIGSNVVTELINKDRVYNDNAEFMFGGEVRGEASYEMTRDIALRFGFTFMDLGKGVARGNNATQFNSQDVQMGGLSFGLTINR